MLSKKEGPQDVIDEASKDESSYSEAVKAVCEKRKEVFRSLKEEKLPKFVKALTEDELPADEVSSSHDSQKVLIADNIRQKFLAADQDGDGRLSRAEIAASAEAGAEEALSSKVKESMSSTETEEKQALSSKVKESVSSTETEEKQALSSKVKESVSSTEKEEKQGKALREVRAQDDKEDNEAEDAAATEDSKEHDQDTDADTKALLLKYGNYEDELYKKGTHKDDDDEDVAKASKDPSSTASHVPPISASTEVSAGDTMDQDVHQDTSSTAQSGKVISAKTQVSAGDTKDQKIHQDTSSTAQSGKVISAKTQVHLLQRQALEDSEEDESTDDDAEGSEDDDSKYKAEDIEVTTTHLRMQAMHKRPHKAVKQVRLLQRQALEDSEEDESTDDDAEGSEDDDSKYKEEDIEALMEKYDSSEMVSFLQMRSARTLEHIPGKDAKEWCQYFTTTPEDEIQPLMEAKTNMESAKSKVLEARAEEAKLKTKIRIRSTVKSSWRSDLEQMKDFESKLDAKDITAAEAEQATSEKHRQHALRVLKEVDGLHEQLHSLVEQVKEQHTRRLQGQEKALEDLGSKMAAYAQVNESSVTEYEAKYTDAKQKVANIIKACQAIEAQGNAFD
eukprot:TRINITY_DN10591_c0_g2_i1.p1 TRINITY_DN10591_c0_g2~~TRINITY_DN10591_c0_g2_i1.p1  ORF type:complete len:709 (-),score=224.40 TRINITY_DN10591_c0_g2_i1:108-1964(-)